MIKLSWSNLELFNECPRCFYFEIRYKVRRPAGFPLNFNNAIDGLMYIKIKDIPSSTVKPVLEEFQASLEQKTYDNK